MRSAPTPPGTHISNSLMAAEYDVAVVGAGSTGAALAARLAERGRSVLLLEAGEIYRALAEFPQALLDPATSALTPGSPHASVLTARLMEGFNQHPVVRGRGMGGSSSINGCAFMRGSRSNFGQWVALGNSEWSFDHVLPYYNRSETDLDFHGHLHGTDGPISVHRDGVNRDPEFTPAFFAGAQEVGFEFVADKNGGDPAGVGPIPANVWGGYRQGTALRYLLPTLERPNLTVVPRAQVLRLLFESRRCVGVQALVDGQPSTFRAAETVVAAGALRTPQILMLSGLGPSEHLRSHGIEVIEDLAGVGSGLTDHPEFALQWDFSGEIKNLPGRARLTTTVNWTAEGSDRSNDLEILLFIARAGEAEGQPHRVVLVGLQQEDSRGTVRLASADPTAPPAIDYNILAEESDRRRVREGMRVAWEIFHSSPVAGVAGGLLNVTAADLSDAAAIDAWVRSHVFGVGHAACTCRMGPASDRSAVVDQHLRVYGVEGLRVADTSVFPEILSCGPNATAVMIGERCSDLVADG